MNQDRYLQLVSGFARARILVLGDVMLDRFVYGKTERISPEAPVPVLLQSHETVMPGGAANVARNIASLGGKATLIGAVGEDAAAADLHSSNRPASSRNPDPRVRFPQLHFTTRSNSSIDVRPWMTCRRPSSWR